MKTTDQGNISRVDRFLFAPADPVMVGAVRIGLALLLLYEFSSHEGWELSGRLDYPAIRNLYETIFFTEAYWWFYMGLLVLFGAGLGSRVHACL